jgi:ribonuclease HI
MTREDAINVFPDGSCKSGPRRGGVGLRIVTFDEGGAEIVEDHDLPGYRNANNQRMELQACILGVREALAHPRFRQLRRILVLTDSRYVCDNYERAMFQWPKQQWRRPGGAPVLNAEQWKELVKLIHKAACRFEVKWIKGKSSAHTKAADKLAKNSADKAIKPPLSIVEVRRKKTEKSVELGSVRMERQTMAIHVFTSEYLKVQRINKYKYEVLSQDSKYHGNVDVIFSRHDLRPAHHYEVVVNERSEYPLIMDVVRELERKSAGKA